MTEESTNKNSTFDEIDRLLADEDFCRAVEASQDNAADITTNSPTSTTADPLNIAVVDETNGNEHQQSHLSQQQQQQLQQSQTIKDASAIIRELMDKTVKHAYQRRIPEPLLMAKATENVVETIDLSSSTAGTIDLCTPTPRTIDLCTPTPRTIDLCTPEITSNVNSIIESPLRLSPK